MNNMLLALDAITALIEIQSKFAAMVQIARSEGRDITPEELAKLRTENKNKLAAFDEDD